MTVDRYVVLGLATTNSDWFRDVGRWSTTGVIPVEFVKAVSIEEVQARLRSGRRFSALLVDAGLPRLDRDVVDLATSHGCPVIVVGGGRVPRDWHALGAIAMAGAELDRDLLMEQLGRWAQPIAPVDHLPLVDHQPSLGQWHGRLVGVMGASGAGASTLAIALAQGLAESSRYRDAVLLADLALHADQAMLHDAGDVIPGLLELVDAHRAGRLGSNEVRSLTYDVPERGYRLLLGLRNHRDWTALRPRAVEASLDGLRRTFRYVVADTYGDLEGEMECGSVDVEERNLLARTTSGSADLVIVVGTHGLTGLQRVVGLVRDLIRVGVEPVRILPVVNRGPRNPRSRAEVTAALATLIRDATGALTPPPIHLPARRHLDDAMHVGSRLPHSISTALSRAVLALVDRLGPVERPQRSPVPVAPGSLGTALWPDENLG